MQLSDKIKKWLHSKESHDTLPDYVSLQFLKNIEDKLDYTFINKLLLTKALVHRSFSNSAGVDRIESNERLEFLGDAVLGLVVNEYLYKEYTKKEEGELTKLKSQLVCGASLADVAREIDLGNNILLSHGEITTGGRDRSSILADTVEALLGAVFLDGGIMAVTKVVNHLILARSDYLLSERELSYSKSKLQEILQATYQMAPRYKLVSATGPDHDREFTVEVSFRDKVFGRGVGPTKKSAEQIAASKALIFLEKNPDIVNGS